MKTCIACGMPMKVKEDYFQQDVTKEFCRYCGKEDGTMKNFAEMIAGTTQFIIETQGVTEEVAREAAVYQLKQLPHWKNSEV